MKIISAINCTIITRFGAMLVQKETPLSLGSVIEGEQLQVFFAEHNFSPFSIKIENTIQNDFCIFDYQNEKYILLHPNASNFEKTIFSSSQLLVTSKRATFFCKDGKTLETFFENEMTDCEFFEEGENFVLFTYDSINQSKNVSISNKTTQFFTFPASKISKKGSEIIVLNAPENSFGNATLTTINVSKPAQITAEKKFFSFPPNINESNIVHAVWKCCKFENFSAARKFFENYPKELFFEIFGSASHVFKIANNKNSFVFVGKSIDCFSFQFENKKILSVKKEF